MSALRTARERARSYLLLGWAVIVVPFMAKNPGYAGWQTTRLTEPELEPAFPDGRPANVGVLLGEPSNGLADVDLDTRLAIRLADRFLPETRAVFGRAGARRSHRLYRILGALKSTAWRDPTVTATDQRAMLLEIRFSGHTLFPGSHHPSGELVDWDEEGEAAVIDEATLLAACNRLAAAVLLTRHWPAVGARHAAALALAGGLLRADWPAEAVVRFLGAVVHGAGDEEPEDRIRAVVSSAEKVAAGRPATGWPTLATLVDPRVVGAATAWLGIPVGPGADPGAELPWDLPTPLPDGPRPDFPTDRLPATLRAFVDALARATQTPPALAALLVLAVLAAAAATRVAVRVRAGWAEPVNLFVAVALGPANRKSSVFAECAEPLERFERDETARQAPKIAQRQSALKIKRKELEALERRAASVEERVTAEEKAAAKERATALARELAAAPTPEPPRLVVDDCSPEKLANLLAGQGGRIAVLSPEGGVFGMMAGRYAASNQPNLDVYLKGHAGDPLRVDRIGRPPDFVPRPALTIGLAVQPGVIRQLAERPEFRERGLPARFLYGMPLSLVGRRQIAAPPVPDDVRAAYHHCVRAVLELPRYKDAEGAPLAKELALSAEADRLLRAFEERLEPRLGEHGDLGHVADWAGKLAGATCRVAGLLHLSEHARGKAPWDTPIPGSTMAATIGIAESFLIPHALAAFAAMGADPALEAARKLLGWAGRNAVTAFSIREAHQELRRHHLTPVQLERAALLLVDHGYLRPVADTQHRGPGRPASPRFAVNPRWAAQIAHNPHNPADDARSGNSGDCVLFEGGSEAMPTPPIFGNPANCVQPHDGEDASPAWEEVVF